MQLVRSAACAAGRVRLADVQDVERRRQRLSMASRPCSPANHSPSGTGFRASCRDDGYAESFGDQWNRWRRVQLDSVTGKPLSRARLFEGTRWPRGPRRPDACSSSAAARDASPRCCSTRARRSGRWTRRRRSTLRATTSATHERLELAQADLFDLPFEQGAFDRVLCFGVLQHTPDPRRAFLTREPRTASGSPPTSTARSRTSTAGRRRPCGGR